MPQFQTLIGTIRIRVPVLRASSIGSAERAAGPRVLVAEGPEQLWIHSFVLLWQAVTSDSVEIQVLFRRVHPPLQHRKYKRRERNQRGKSSEYLPEAARY
ncbi:MAG TPA: hypothetical protein VFO39_21725 [Candidatus Sulfotelmatobacter sp.]|nr:hypothetical protein [Candidatus Sulfotelmatobacter sp.]